MVQYQAIFAVRIFWIFLSIARKMQFYGVYIYTNRNDVK